MVAALIFSNCCQNNCILVNFIWQLYYKQHVLSFVIQFDGLLTALWSFDFCYTFIQGKSSIHVQAVFQQLFNRFHSLEMILTPVAFSLWHIYSSKFPVAHSRNIYIFNQCQYFMKGFTSISIGFWGIFFFVLFKQAKDNW